MPHFTRLDLELDDWLDPSLPRNRPSPPPGPGTIGLDFTDCSREFRDTTLFPVWTPVMGAGGLELRWNETGLGWM